MLIKLIVSTKVSDGTWKNPGAVIELDDVEAKRMLKLGAATRPSSSELGSDNTTFSAEEMDDMISALTDIDGVSEKLVGDMIEAGFTSVKEVAKGSVGELVAIKGIGGSTAQKMIESAEGLLDIE